MTNLERIRLMTEEELIELIRMEPCDKCESLYCGEGTCEAGIRSWLRKEVQDEPKIHDLKTAPQWFQAVLDGEKTFEVRINDRGFRVGDKLRLREWQEKEKIYTRRTTLKTVRYILEAPWALRENYIVMAIE